MRFNNPVLFLGVSLSLAVSDLSYSGDVKVPQYLVTERRVSSDPVTGKPVYANQRMEIKSIKQLSSSPEILVFTAVGTPERTFKIRLSDKNFASYLKENLETFESSYIFDFKGRELYEGGGFSANSLLVRNSAGEKVDVTSSFLKPRVESGLKRILKPQFQSMAPRQSLKKLDEWLEILKAGSSWKRLLPDEGIGWREIDWMALRWGLCRSISSLFDDWNVIDAILKESLPGIVAEWRKGEAERYALESQKDATERHEVFVVAAKAKAKARAEENCKRSGGSSWGDLLSSSLQTFNVFGLGSDRQRPRSPTGRTESRGTYQALPLEDVELLERKTALNSLSEPSPESDYEKVDLHPKLD